MTYHQSCRTAAAGLLLALLALFLVIRPIEALATTWKVSSSGGGCTTGDPNCSTIQGAINGASTGETINVFPGLYSETAPIPPSYGSGTVGLYIPTNGLTIQGVDSGGAPITDPGAVEATVNTISNLDFGPDGFFVTGDSITIAGIRVGTNTGGQNKTIEIIGDNFALKDCDIADLQGSVYINDFTCTDPTATISHVQSYTIQGNIFEDGVSLDIANGAGLSGGVGGRTVTGNTFKNLATTVGAEYWPSVSLTGSDTGIPWFVCSVGGAVITGNTFSNSAPDGQLIRARGTYDNTQFNWASYWNANTFNKAAVVGAFPPAVVETYSYPNSYGTFNHVRRIGATIQGEVANALANDTALVAAGTYPENVVIATTGLTLAGAGQALSTIIPAVSNANPCEGSSLCGGAASNIILVQADNVTIQDFTLDGDNPNLTSGIMRDGADLDARNGIITDWTVGDVHNLDVHNTTVQNVYLRGIYSTSAGSGNTFNFHDNTVHNVQGDYYSIGMFAFTASGSMTHNTVSDAGDAISANWSLGITFSDNTVTNSGSGVHTDNSGGSDVIQGNTVSNCTPGGWGVWTFAPYVSPTVRSNTVTNCDLGLAASGGGGIATAFSDNVVDGMNRPGSVGAYVTTSQFGNGSANVSTTFTGNLIENTTDGFQLQDKTCSATTTQGCKTDSNCPPGETCTLGYTLTATATCNRITDNGTGILTEALAHPALTTFNSNIIAGNGVGIDGSALPAGPPLAAQNDFWGCAAGPGSAGCDTVVGNVAALPAAASAPACAYCSVNSECNDGLACNGVETCNLGTSTCQAGMLRDCSSLNDICKTGTCSEPNGDCAATPKANGTSCSSGGATCQAGVCSGSSGSLIVASARLKRNTATKPRFYNGSVTVQAIIIDEDTGGTLVDNLKNKQVTVDVQDEDGSGNFYSPQPIVSLSSCTPNKALNRVSCKGDKNSKITATFTKIRYFGHPYGAVWKMTMSRSGFATDSGVPTGPIRVTLHQGPVDRSDSPNDCSSLGASKNTLVCYHAS